MFLGAGCGPRQGSTLIIAHEDGVIGMDPHRQDEAVTVSILANIFEGLVSFDQNLKLVPRLAEGYSNPSDLVWNFHLRKDVRFHDGKEMTAADVEYSIKRAWTDTGSVFRGMLSGITEVRTVDPHTVEIVTGKPQLTLIKVLTQVAVIPTNSHPDSQPVGTGPYRFGSSLPGRGLRLERFEGYWGRAPEHPMVEFRSIPAEEDRAAALIRGDIDFDAAVSEGQRKRLESAEGVSLLVLPSASVGVLGINLEGSFPGNPLADRRVRQSVSLAIDRRRLSAEAYGGYTQPAWQPVPPSVVGHDPAIPKLGCDPDRSRELLRAAGIRDSLRLVLEMAGSAWPVGRELKRQLREVGISLRVDTVSWDRLYRDIYAGTSRFYLMGFAFGFGDASEILNELHTYGPADLGVNNLTGYSNPRLDKLLEKADQEFDPARRQALLQESVRLVTDDLPYIPLYLREYCYGIRNGLAWAPRSDGLVLAEEFRRR